MTPRSSFGTRYNQLVKLFKGRIVKTSLPVREKVRWSETLLQERVLPTANGCRCKPISNPLFLRNGEHCRWKAAWSINYIILLLRNAQGKWMDYKLLRLNNLQVSVYTYFVQRRSIHIVRIVALCSFIVLHGHLLYTLCLNDAREECNIFFCFSYFISINFNIRYVVKKLYLCKIWT